MTTPQPISEFFTAGGTLPKDAPSYVTRPTDDELLRHVMAGEFCYVLTPRQMGKSSLMIRTAQRLRNEGIKSAIVDLTQIGTVESEDTWYKGVLTQVTRRLKLTIEPIDWWEQKKDIPNIQKFIEFFEEALSEVKEHIVIFMDEIDTTLKLDFRDNFFAGIRAIFNARAENPNLNRVTFVLLGVASPSDLIKDRNRTPFNIGQEILLRPFNRKDALMLEKGLEETYKGFGSKILDRVFYWTHGHPYLTQKLCSEIVDRQREIWDDSNIDALVNELFLSEQARKETNLKFVQDRLLDNPHRVKLLNAYNKILESKVREDGQSPIQNELKLSGLVLLENGILKVGNRIYKTVFNARWVKENTPNNLYRIGTLGLAFVIVLLLAIFSYVVVDDFLIGKKITENQTAFYGSTNSSERLSSLANIFRSKGRLQYTDTLSQARELFFTLNKDEQLKLFSNSDIQNSSDLYPDLIIVINKLHVTFADLDENGDSNDLLLAMYNSLEKVTSEDGTKLREEIGFWLMARGVIKDDYNAGQLSYYNQAIIKAVELNPATLYERARIRIRTGDYDTALEDLNKVINIANEISQEGESASGIATSSPASVFPSATLETSTLVDITATVTPTLPSTLPITTNTPEPSPSSSAASITNTPSSNQPISTEIPPTPIISLPGYRSNFYTYIGMVNAVRLLLLDNKPLLDVFYANTDRYASLADSGLISLVAATPISPDLFTAFALTPTLISTSTITPIPAITPSPSVYSPIVTFDENLKIIDCWVNDPVLPQEGFYRRTDQYWGFKVGVDHSAEDAVQVDFSQCFGGRKFSAFALNVDVARLELEKELGFFLESQNGQRREYTFWLDQNEAMHLRVRENNNIINDDVILVVNDNSLRLTNNLPVAYTFPVQIFFEMNNQGLDIIYMREGSLGMPVSTNDIDPNQMIRVDNAALPTLGDVQKIGLVGRGGKTEAIIWPLTFLELVQVSTVSTSTPTIIPVLGYGRLTEYTYPFTQPNGDLLGIQLSPKQYVTIVERQEINGLVWYDCKWDINSVTGEGWIWEKYIQFAPPPTPTLVSTDTPSIARTSTFTLTPLPTLIIGSSGINLPSEFRVGPWYDDSSFCDPKIKIFTVDITAVEITGGTPPYNVTFSQSNRTIYTTQIVPVGGRIEFIDPVVVARGGYLHVNITFQSVNGESTWVDDLYYPPCP